MATAQENPPGSFPSHDALSTLDDPTLVGLCRTNHPDSWAVLVERYNRLVISIARRYDLSGDDAHDVAQSVWLNVVNALPTLKGNDKFKAWLVRIAYNQTFDFLRKRTQSAAPETVSYADSGFSRVEDMQTLQRAIQQLKPREQAFVQTLVAYPDSSYAELSQMTGMPHESFGTTKRRILGKMRKILTA